MAVFIEGAFNRGDAAAPGCTHIALVVRTREPQALEKAFCRSSEPYAI